MIHNLYQETLMDHYRNPRNRGAIPNPDFSSGVYNPSCGDAISMEGIIAEGAIRQLVFEGKGCVISQASASLLTQKVMGYTIHDVTALDTPFMQSLVGMSLGPTRLTCALLPLQALQDGLKKYTQTKG